MTLKEIIKDRSAKLIDVRTPAEFNGGHISGAVNIPLDQLRYTYKEIEGLGKSPVVFYCHSGNRSSQAVTYLLQKGIKNVYNGGGLEDIKYYLN